MGALVGRDGLEAVVHELNGDPHVFEHRGDDFLVDRIVLRDEDTKVWPASGGVGLGRVRVRLSGYFLDRKPEVEVEPERRALSHGADDLEVPSHPSHDPARNREPEPRTSVLPCRGAVCLTERLEDLILRFERDSDPGVLDFEPHTQVIGRRVRGEQCRVDGHGSVFGESDRVSDQVHENLTQPPRVGAHEHGDTGIRLRTEFDLSCGGLCLEFCADRSEE